MTDGVPVVPFRRSAFQVALLMFASAGLYVFVWAFFIRRACASLLEQDDQPLWKSIALIVPLFNFFLLYDLGRKIQGVQWRADPTRVDGSLPWVGVSMFAFTILGKLKSPVDNLGVLSLVPIALMHQHFSRAQSALLGAAATPTRFHWLEWLVIALGAAFWGLIVNVERMPATVGGFAPNERIWFVACTTLALASVAIFRVTGRRALAEGLAMYANPSPDRIAPYAS